MLSIYLDIDADFIADEEYETFGIKGLEADPRTCQQRDPVANTHSHTNNVALYVPGYGILRLPPGPAVAPSAGISIKPPGSKLTFANAFYMPKIGRASCRERV